MTIWLDPDNETGLSRPNSKTGRLQRALLKQLDVHYIEGTVPTNLRFLFYELEGLGVVSKAKTGTRTAGQDLSRALGLMTESGRVPWEWIEDETRILHTYKTASSVAAYVKAEVNHASLDRWDGEAAPLILCESRSLAGVLLELAAQRACPIAATNGQAGGFLVTQVAPLLARWRGRRVCYLGDHDLSGHQIEAATKRTLANHVWKRLSAIDQAEHTIHGWTAAEYFDHWYPWERVALTEEQVTEHGLERHVMTKTDNRYNPPKVHEAIETEALGQRLIVDLLRDRLNELMPEPIADIIERQTQQREEVAETLEELDGTGTDDEEDES